MLGEELLAASCLARNQSGGVRNPPLEDDPDVEYGTAVPIDVAALAEEMARAASVAVPKVTRYYQGRACSRARRTKEDIYLCLIHTPEGGESGTLSVLNGTGASFDWFLPLSGNLYQCNDYHNFIAWQAGDWPVNQRSIGIEQGDYASRSGGFGDDHYKRLAWLCAWLAETLDLNIRRTRDKHSYGFISHADVTPGQRTDPGAGFLWDKLLDYTLDYRQGRTPGEKPVPQPPPQAGKLYKVQSGAFREKENADRLAEKMQEKNFETYIVHEDGLFKVQTGAFTEKAFAESHEQRVERAGFDAFIQRSSGKA